MHPTAPPADRLHPTTILLVDDEVALRQIAARMLCGFGYTVVEADSRRAAMKEFRANPERFDLVLLDLHLPDGTGRDVARDVRAMRPDVRVLYYSGSAGDGRGNAELVGVGESVLAKPFTMGELREAVRSVIAATI